ncbi:hypothetical protein [Sphingomicrobium clamense]|uniref:Lipoprotein n=1 Tax=Sphingomicrobium clamense TaxID=2851013 RepID=A0ABS6V868_9SPHN|nr:hypothetical protein [Sphingomicrobium sp. B8]MBW0145253.1 hypothetical protein [Sphingomicrobium sp. B8]
MKLGLIAISALALSACVGGGGGFGGGYWLAEASQERKVGDGGMYVTPPRDWNRASRSIITSVREVEDWTLNGPYLDGISFVSGLKEGEALVDQRRKATRQVPEFKADMLAPEVASMIESFFRSRAGAIEFVDIELKPRQFMGYPGFQYDYDHLDGDEVWRRGRVVGAVIGDRLYFIMLDAARSHYFDAALPDFEAIVESARLSAKRASNA